MYPVAHRLLTVVLLAALVTAGTAGVAVEASGAAADVQFVESDVTEDTTWTAEEGPYRLIRDVEVAPGATLTVAPGTEVQFAEDRTLAVAGSLRAAGTADSPVTFRKTAGAPADARWDTIRYEGGEGSTFTLANATVRDARTGITVASEAGSVELRDATIRSVSRHGLAVGEVASAPDLAIERSSFEDVGDHGIAATPASGTLERIRLATSTDATDESARHTLSLEPGVEATVDRIELAYGSQADVSGVTAGTIGRFGLDTDDDGSIERSLSPLVSSASATDGTIAVQLSEAVRVPGDARLVLAVGGIGNPETRGVYRVDVTASRDGVSQLADGVYAPYAIGGVTTEHAATDVVRETDVSSLSVRDAHFENVGGAGVRIDADTVRRIRLSQNRFEGVGGEGIGLRARTLDGTVVNSRIAAADAGVAVAVRERVGHLTVANTVVSGSETGLRVRQSGARAGATVGMTVENNEFVENARQGIHVRADDGRLSGGSIAENVIRENGRSGIAIGVDGVDDVTVADNTIADNGRDGVSIRTRRLRSTTVTDTDLSGNGGDGLALRTFASVRGLDVRNVTATDNGGHGLAIRTDLVAHDVSVVDDRLANNAGAGLHLTGPLTHGGTVEVGDNVVAANTYGIVLQGALRANVTGNAVVFNTNERVDPVPLDGVEPGTAVAVAEGPAGVVLDRGETAHQLSDLVDDPSVDATLRTVGTDDETAVVLRTDGEGHVRLREDAALSIDRMLSDLPTGVALPTRGNETGIHVVENDVYGQSTGLAVDIAPLIEANTTARLLVTDVRRVTAEDTYWGAPTGPFHDSILPGGDGDPVLTRTGWVDFIPFANASHGPSYARPEPRLDAPANASPGETVVVDASDSTATNAAIDRYYFTVDGETLPARTDPVLSVTVPDTEGETVNVRLAVEDDLGIENDAAANVTIQAVEPEPTTTAPTTTTTAGPPTTAPPPDRSGPLGTIFAILGGIAYLLAVLAGAYGMALTLRERNPPFDGRLVHALAAGGVVAWAVGGLLAGDRLLLLAGVAAVVWIVATGVAYFLAQR